MDRTETGEISPGESRQQPAASGRSLLAKTIASFLHLIAGNGSATAINGLVLVVIARTLGPGTLGFFAMIESFGTVVDQLVRLESWQPMIRYGSQALERGEEDRFRALIKLGVMIDFAGASLAALVAFVAVPFVAILLNWPDETQSLARWYCLAVLAGVSSTPVAILRLFDRFRQLAWFEPAAAALRLLGVWIAFEFHGGLRAAVFVFIGAQIAYRGLLGTMAWRELRRHGHSNFLAADWRTLRGIVGGYVRLMLATNVSALVRKSTQELDVLVLGGLAGPAAAGIYELVRRVTQAAIKAGTMLQQVAFPDLGRLWARRDFAAFRSLVLQIEILTAGMGIVFVALVAFRGGWLVTALAGDRFQGAGLPLLVQSVAACLFLCGSAVRVALITIGREVVLLGIVMLSAGAFYAVLYLAVPRLGAAGASAAHVAFNAILLPLGSLAYWSALRRLQHGSPHDHSRRSTRDSLPISQPAYD